MDHNDSSVSVTISKKAHIYCRFCLDLTQGNQNVMSNATESRIPVDGEQCVPSTLEEKEEVNSFIVCSRATAATTTWPTFQLSRGLTANTSQSTTATWMRTTPLVSMINEDYIQ
jgi:hypothetical protein